MEYGQESDRLYTKYSGGLKLIFNDGKTLSGSTSFYIKYEKNLPGCTEVVHREEEDGKILDGIIFYKYNDTTIGILDIGVISNELIVTKDNVFDDEGNPVPMENLNYVKNTINTLTCDMNQISISYTLDNNLLNDIKIGILGVSTQGKKFISYKIVDNCIEPAYFIVQAPKNRSWICYRLAYTYSYPGPTYGSSRRLNGCTCRILYFPESSLNGYFGEYDASTSSYKYTINIDKTKTYYTLLLPDIFWDFDSIIFKDSSDNTISYSGYNFISGTTSSTPIDIYNEGDGMFYRCWTLPQASSISKIIVSYHT